MSWYNSIYEEEQMDEIRKAHKYSMFKSTKKALPIVKQLLPGLNNDELIKKVLNKDNENSGDKRKYSTGTNPNRVFGHPIFSSSPNCWFHDLLDNGKTSHPRYWHIFIGVNNHYAVAYGINDKKAPTIENTLRKFAEEYKPYKLTSDEGREFFNNLNTSFLEEQHIKFRRINAKYFNHAGLGIIDRFCKTIRMMNHRLLIADKDKYDDTESQREPISYDNMDKILNTYNNSYHSRIKMTPYEMFKNPNKEKDYIFEHLEYRSGHYDYDIYNEREDYRERRKHKRLTREEFERNKERKNKKRQLNLGDWVYYILPKDNFNKRRSNISEGIYKVVGFDGFKVQIRADDGTHRLVDRQYLKKCNSDGSAPENALIGKHLDQYRNAKNIIDDYQPQYPENKHSMSTRYQEKKHGLKPIFYSLDEPEQEVINEPPPLPSTNSSTILFSILYFLSNSKYS